jgi:hypothetical protein
MHEIISPAGHLDSILSSQLCASHPALLINLVPSAVVVLLEIVIEVVLEPVLMMMMMMLRLNT